MRATPAFVAVLLVVSAVGPGLALTAPATASASATSTAPVTGATVETPGGIVTEVGDIDLEVCPAERGSDGHGRGKVHRILGDPAIGIGHFSQRHAGQVIVLQRDHAVPRPSGDQRRGVGAEVGGQPTVKGGGRAAPLDVTEHGRADLAVEPRLELLL